jgi:predicted transposase YdaD
MAKPFDATMRELFELAPAAWLEFLGIPVPARYPREQVEELIEGVATMILGIRGIEDSWVYQGILAKGRAEGEAKGRAEAAAEEARKTLLRQGRKKLSPPDARIEAESGIGGSLAAPPLPHHRAYGSVHGGSIELGSPIR